LGQKKVQREIPCKMYQPPNLISILHYRVRHLKLDAIQENQQSKMISNIKPQTVNLQNTNQKFILQNNRNHLKK